MILDQENQQRLSSTKSAWEQIRTIGRHLFFIGACLVAAHFPIEIVALVGTFGKVFLVPSWLWIELDILVYLLAPFLWVRLLFVYTTYRLSSERQNYYALVLVGSAAAFLLSLNLRDWYADGAFPLLCGAYVLQVVLDMGLPHQVSAPKSMPKKETKNASSQAASARKKRSSFHIAASVPLIPLPRRNGHPKGAIDQVPGQRVQRVGIWYSPTDERFAQRLRIHLQPDIRNDMIDLWDPEHISPGTIWQKERLQAVQSAAVAVVLLSADFLACDFIAQDELPQLLSRARTQGTMILLIHVSPCDIKGSGLEWFQAVNSPEKPLAQLNRPGRDSVLSRTATIIRQKVGL